MGPPAESGVTALRAGDFEFPLDRAHLLGIVNVNDDSFCGDGSLDLETILAHARRLLAEGAEILDVGGESARTNRAAISETEEIGRVVPVLRALRNEFPAVPLSLNTWRAAVAEAGLEAGASILDDISGLPSADHAKLAARHGAALVIMHTQGEPKKSHRHVAYENVVAEMEAFFRNKLELAAQSGLTQDRILLDPGLDFAKQRDDNFRVLAALGRLARLGPPILLAASRKSFLGDELGGRPPLERDWATLAASMWALEHGARFLRVHAVAMHADAIRLWSEAAGRGNFNFFASRPAMA
ncbi:MAG: dihydropteroate synthase [Verrucomicrobiae bacterium]|nr:dihydropteroate synthase [Verrucomicrobiae bacterium]